jgi:two-component system cell cycle response regulator
MTGSSRHRIKRRFSLGQVLRTRAAGDASTGDPAVSAAAGSARSGAAERPFVDNAQSLDRELELELERAKRGSRRLSVLLGEFVGSDQNGDRRSTPDELLLERVASVFVEQKRQIDVLAALDHGRFVLVLPETDESGALSVAERLRVAVAAVLRDQGAAPKLSFGAASFGRHGRSSGALLEAAERALRAAQRLDQQNSLIDPDQIAAAMASVMSDTGAEGRLETALALAETVDIRDRGLAGHSLVVGRYASLIAREFGLSDETIDRVRLAGALHDVGKVGVARTVLQKPGPLSEREWNAIRTHSEIGASLLDGPELSDISEWVLRHHERPDGRGYPDGLRGSQIAIEARIIAVADAYEAMTSDRVHRAALSHDEAQAELVRGAGTQFDNRVVDAFIRVLKRQGLGSSRAAA